MQRITKIYTWIDLSDHSVFRIELSASTYITEAAPRILILVLAVAGAGVDILDWFSSRSYKKLTSYQTDHNQRYDTFQLTVLTYLVTNSVLDVIELTRWIHNNAYCFFSSLLIIRLILSATCYN